MLWIRGYKYVYWIEVMKFWIRDRNSIDRLKILLFFCDFHQHPCRNRYWYRSGQVDRHHRHYGNSGARRSFGGPIGVGGASVVPGLCWETRTSLYRLRWRRRIVPGSRLGRHQLRHGGRWRWRYSAKLRIQYRRTRLILSAHRLTLPPLPLIVPEYLSGTSHPRPFLLPFSSLGPPVPQRRKKEEFISLPI